jgi:hypothetical protein
MNFKSEWYWDNVDVKAYLIKLNLIRRDRSDAIPVGKTTKISMDETS